MFLRNGAAAAAVGLVLALTGAGSAAAQPESGPDPATGYPSGLGQSLTNSGSSPSGANDWSCRPSSNHPVPVVLLPGLGNVYTEWTGMARALANAGYCVFTTNYGAGILGPTLGAVVAVPDSAAQISTFIDRVRSATHTTKVDLVGHSMGGAVPFYYLNHLGGIPKVNRYVAIGAPLHGSDTSGTLPPLRALLQAFGLGDWMTTRCGPCVLYPGSPYLAVLDADAAQAPKIQFTAIVTRYDEIATPYVTGILAPAPNVHNVVVQDLCPTDYTDHLEEPFDPIVVGVVRNALDPTHPTPIPCPIVYPIIGPH